MRFGRDPNSSHQLPEAPKIAVVIPCYKVRDSIEEVIGRIGPMVSHIYLVDDRCPEQTGEYARTQIADSRLKVLIHPVNQGVGGATVTGYRQALADGAEIIVKIDGDGQMDPALIPRFVQPIIEGRADYTKGNRFYSVDSAFPMPPIRLAGNIILSFMAKLSTGYWHIFDPNNGYTAIHASVLRELPLDKLSRGYFFESDLLFRLYTLRCAVVDIPMRAQYGLEMSNLRIGPIIPTFLLKHGANLMKRLFYTYYLRNFNIYSLEIILGVLLLVGGVIYGTAKWIIYARMGIPATSGTVMLGALPIILGSQMILAFINHDSQNIPTRPVYDTLPASPGAVEPVTGEKQAVSSGM